jgi:hypothetical protein
MARRLIALPVLLLVAIVAVAARGQGSALRAERICTSESKLQSEVPFTQAQVADLLGFWHPLLQEVVDMPEYPFVSLPYVYPYFVLQSCSLHGDVVYIALYIPAIASSSTILVFELAEGQITAAGYSFDLMGLPHLSAISGFADRNFNGYPDMVVWANDTGNMSENPLLLLEWGDNGIVDITPPVTDGSPNGLEDIDRDGVPELLDTNLYFIPTQQGNSALVQQLRSWFRWNGVAYEMVAVQVYPFAPSSRMVLNYMRGITVGSIEDSGPYIEDFLNSLSLEQICELVGIDDRAVRPEQGLSARLFQILLYHRAWNHAQEGWNAIEPITTLATTCPESAGKTFFFSALDG